MVEVERLARLDFFFFKFVLFFCPWMQKRLSPLRTPLLTPEDGIPPVRLRFCPLTSKYDGVRLCACAIVPLCVCGCVRDLCSVKCLALTTRQVHEGGGRLRACGTPEVVEADVLQRSCHGA